MASLHAVKTVDDYLQMADAQALAHERYWHILLHIPDKRESEIDDPAFFLSERGKHDPAAELNATIEALFNEESFDDNATACRFPARTFWLTQKLGMKNLPAVKCQAFGKLIKRVDPKSVTLVFPYAHINSPASMFGHTFLRIDSSYESKMLSYAINYAADADTDTENGVVFAIKGLFGGYYGKYSLLPYYDKLKEYRDTEQRDIWEYDLDLNEDEVMQMMRHIWELNNTFSWYYFFDENCSYNMLWLIEAARESIHLREYFAYQVIPPESVHAVKQEKIVQKRHYRPSKRSRLLAYEDALRAEAKEEVIALADGILLPSVLLDDENYTTQEKRYILEAASEMTEYRYIENDINKSTYQQRFHGILSTRAHLGKGETVKIAEPENPDSGHQALRLKMESGWREGRPIQFLGFRPAYHSIDDSDVGYLRGTQIEFLNTLLNYSEHALHVEEATILSIVSLAQRSDFFKPFSWRMRTGWDRRSMSEDAAFSLSVGFGESWGGQWGYLYMIADPYFYLKTHFNAGIGGSAGAVLYAGKEVKTVVEMSERLYDDGSTQSLAHASVHWRSSQNSAFSCNYDYVEKAEKSWNTFKLSFDYFF